MMKHRYDKDEVPPRDHGDDLDINVEDNNSHMTDNTDYSKVWRENEGTTEEGFWWDNNSGGGEDEGFVNSHSALGMGHKPDTKHDYGLSSANGEATSSMIRSASGYNMNRTSSLIDPANKDNRFNPARGRDGFYTFGVPLSDDESGSSIIVSSSDGSSSLGNARRMDSDVEKMTAKHVWNSMSNPESDVSKARERMKIRGMQLDKQFESREKKKPQPGNGQHKSTAVDVEQRTELMMKPVSVNKTDGSTKSQQKDYKRMELWNWFMMGVGIIILLLLLFGVIQLHLTVQINRNTTEMLKEVINNNFNISNVNNTLRKLLTTCQKCCKIEN